MNIVYQLRLDQKFIDQVQKATLTTREFGLQPTHGLFGSSEWWKNIELGRLQLYTVRGVIDEVYMGSMNDWPMCKVRSDDGEVSNWTREMHDPLSDSLYKTGAKIEIDFVIQKSKDEASWCPEAEQKQVVEIRIHPEIHSRESANRF